MTRKRTFLRILQWSGAALLLAVTVGTFYWSHEIQHEASAIRQTAELLKSRDMDGAGKIIDSLAQRRFRRIRSYFGIEHLPGHLLSGAALFEVGEYDRALRAFNRVAELCENKFIRLQYSSDLCRRLQAQMRFRSGEAVLRRMKARSYNEAVELYKSGLQFDPDDPQAKRMLDWLLVQVELGEKTKKKDREAGRGDSPFDQGGVGGDRPGGGPGTGQERKGY